METNKTKKKQPKLFDSTYYRNKYVSYICKLPKSESERLNKFLEENDLGFTEFVRSSLELLEGKKIVIEKRLE